MSTELKSLKGKNWNQEASEFENAEMSLTRFSGGKEGMKLQLTMRNNGTFFTSIALNKKEIKKLIKELQENFDLITKK
jgi:ABC-type Na+ transport system ATPase subunit NatA|tara:strand:+ start:425 stop:658 length:234 start_codon:yes stop_codon:yes gene_type:complete